jgi:hypothetical protein
MFRQLNIFSLTLLLLIATVCPATAEIATWAHSFGDGEGDFYANSMQMTSDGGFILGGVIATWFQIGHFDSLLMRLNSSGDLIWSLQDPNYSDYNHINWVEQTSDGGFIAGGKLDGAWLMKLDSDGNIQWEKTYMEQVDSYREVVKIHEIPNKGYIMIGNEIASDFSETKMWLVQIDLNGNIVWQKGFSIQGDKFISVGDLEVTSDDGFILCGSYQGGSWILKTDSVGEIVWQKFSIDGYVGQISPTSDGGYFALGSDGVNSVFLKLNRLGEIQWQRMIDPADLNWVYAYANSFRELPDGAFLIVGIGALPDWPNSPRQWLIKINAKGKLLWQKSFSNVFGGALVASTADGGIAMAGGEFSYLSNEYGRNNTFNSYSIERKLIPSEGTLGQNILISKMNKNGNVDTLCTSKDKFLFQNSQISFKDGSLNPEIPTVQSTDVSFTFSRSQQWEFENHTFCDEFEKNALSKDWRFHGNWSQKRGNLIGNGSGSNNATALIPMKDVSYYAVRAELQTSGGHDDEVSLIAYWQNKDNYVELIMSKTYGHWAFQRWVDGSIVNYDSVSREISTDRLYPVSIVLSNQESGPVLVANTGSSFLYLPLPPDASMMGKIGFRAKDAKGVFGSLRIRGNVQ